MSVGLLQVLLFDLSDSESAKSKVPLIDQIFVALQ